MRNLKVLGISVETAEIPLKPASIDVFGQTKPRLWSSAGSGSVLSSLEPGLTGTPVPLAALPRIQLKLSDARPTSSAVSFWIDGQPLLGAVLDESKQTLTGYVTEPVANEVEVRAVYQNGDEKKFNLVL